MSGWREVAMPPPWHVSLSLHVCAIESTIRFCSKWTVLSESVSVSCLWTIVLSLRQEIVTEGSTWAVHLCVLQSCCLYYYFYQKVPPKAFLFLSMNKLCLVICVYFISSV